MNFAIAAKIRSQPQSSLTRNSSAIVRGKVSYELMSEKLMSLEENAPLLFKNPSVLS